MNSPHANSSFLYVFSYSSMTLIVFRCFKAPDSVMISVNSMLKTLYFTSDYVTIHETNMIFRKLTYMKHTCFLIVFVSAHKYVGLNDALRPLILLWFLSTPCWKPLYFTSDFVTVHETNMIFWKLKYIKHICFPIEFLLTHRYVGLN